MIPVREEIIKNPKWKEVNEMRKVTITSIVAALCLVLTYGMAGAVVGGPCVDCHTMHNSQNGVVVVAGGPYQTLLKGDCIGCHGTTLADNLLGTNNTIPAVMHQHATDLAGGNFAYITGGKAVDAADSIAVANKDTVGHNVMDLGAANQEDIVAMFPPPGDEYNQVGILAGTFTCAGTLGCHGDRTIAGSMAAVRGSHHAIDSMLKFGTINEATQGTSTYNSYRFLKGVHGGEDSDWQNTVAVGDHNEYKGATAGVEAGSASTPGGGTISGLCAECHGTFHGDAADIGSGPWLRHPTDIVLPAAVSKEYYKYNAGVGANNPYSLNAPVGRATIPNAVSAVVNPGTDDSIVTCLSCHKAHASANQDILRWNYEDINAGSGVDENARCFICHTTKDGV
jgi:hypothetical protein